MPSLSDALPPELLFKDTDQADADRMNRAMVYIVGQLRAALALRVDYQAVLDQLAALGLQRLAEALQPVVQKAQDEAGQLQAIFDEWVTGDALTALHGVITSETDAKIAGLQGQIDTANGRIDDVNTAAAALEARLTGDRWYQNHG